MSLVWECYRAGGSAKLALLALADWADDSGGSIFPSVETVARKICASESQARRLIRSFERSGLLKCVANAHGGAPGSTRHYRLNLGMLTAGTDATPSTDATRAESARDGSHGCALTGSTGARRRVAPVRPNPSLNRQVNHQGTDCKQGFAEFWLLWPKKQARVGAMKAWAKLRPDAGLRSQILAAVTAQASSRDWKKDGGRFIPHAATWLNGRRWEDDLAAANRGHNGELGVHEYC